MENKKAPDRELRSFLRELKGFFLEMSLWMKVCTVAASMFQVYLVWDGQYDFALRNMLAMVGGFIGAEIIYRLTR